MLYTHFSDSDSSDFDWGPRKLTPTPISTPTSTLIPTPSPAQTLSYRPTLLQITWRQMARINTTQWYHVSSIETRQKKPPLFQSDQPFGRYASHKNYEAWNSSRSRSRSGSYFINSDYSSESSQSLFIDSDSDSSKNADSDRLLLRLRLWLHSTDSYPRSVSCYIA